MTEVIFFCCTAIPFGNLLPAVPVKYIDIPLKQRLYGLIFYM